AGDHHAPRRRLKEPCEYHRDRLLAAAGWPDDRHAFREPERERDAFEQRRAILDVAHVDERHLTRRIERRHRLRLLELQPLVEESGWLELLDHLLVLDAGIFLLLVEEQQLLPGRGHILVGSEHGHERTERKITSDDQ